MNEDSAIAPPSRLWTRRGRIGMTRPMPRTSIKRVIKTKTTLARRVRMLRIHSLSCGETVVIEAVSSCPDSRSHLQTRHAREHSNQSVCIRQTNRYVVRARLASSWLFAPECGAGQPRALDHRVELRPHDL